MWVSVSEWVSVCVCEWVCVSECVWVCEGGGEDGKEEADGKKEADTELKTKTPHVNVGK